MYQIKKENGHYVSYKDGKVASKCFTEEDCLHSLWVIEGKIQQDFYVLNDYGIVERVNNEQDT